MFINLDALRPFVILDGWSFLWFFKCFGTNTCVIERKIF